MEKKIENYTVYNERMRKSLSDKTWWIDKIDTDTNFIIDFGCADASIMLFIEKYFPNRYNYIGIDCNEVMLQKAKENYPQGHYYSSYSEMVEYEKEHFSHSVLIFNSVIHEIMTYCTTEEIHHLINEIDENSPKYIAVRDMSFPWYKGSGNINVWDTFDGIFNSKYVNEWLDFWKSKSNCWGIPLTTFTEFFLKYTYKENWEREKDEIYLWEWEFMFPKKYKCLTSESFNIQPIVDRIRRDFGVDWSHVMTHAKLLLKWEPKND